MKIIFWGLLLEIWYKELNTRLEEVLNEISFSRFLEDVDSKIWRLHLQRVRDMQCQILTITGRNMNDVCKVTEVARYDKEG